MCRRPTQDFAMGCLLGGVPPSVKSSSTGAESFIAQPGLRHDRGTAAGGANQGCADARGARSSSSGAHLMSSYVTQCSPLPPCADGAACPLSQHAPTPPHRPLSWACVWTAAGPHPIRAECCFPCSQHARLFPSPPPEPPPPRQDPTLSESGWVSRRL